MSIVYDYSTAPLDDPFVALVERSLEISVRELRPEVAAVVSEFPICAYCSAALTWLGCGPILMHSQWRNFLLGFLERAL
jgi:hypothetical protein